MEEKILSWLYWLLQEIKQHPFISTGIALKVFIFVAYKSGRKLYQKIKQHPLLSIGIALGAWVIAVYMFGLEWTGFFDVPSKTTTVSTPEGIITVKEVQLSKTFWDWLNLLGVLAIPVAVATYTVRQDKARDAEMKDNQNEAALQAYLNNISELLLHEHLLDEWAADSQSQQKYKQVRNVARVRTIAVLTQLNARRVGCVFAFLRGVGLMNVPSMNNIISLEGADLHAVNWNGAFLYEANLIGTNLQGADLQGAFLREAFLERANLQGTILKGATLEGAHFQGAHLQGANLQEANLQGANLQGANLQGANLQSANLKGADLKGAIMPDG